MTKIRVRKFLFSSFFLLGVFLSGVFGGMPSGVSQEALAFPWTSLYEEEGDGSVSGGGCSQELVSPEKKTEEFPEKDFTQSPLSGEPAPLEEGQRKIVDHLFRAGLVAWGLQWLLILGDVYLPFSFFPDSIQGILTGLPFFSKYLLWGASKALGGWKTFKEAQGWSSIGTAFLTDLVFVTQSVWCHQAVFLRNSLYKKHPGVPFHEPHEEDGSVQWVYIYLKHYWGENSFPSLSDPASGLTSFFSLSDVGPRIRGLIEAMEAEEQKVAPEKEESESDEEEIEEEEDGFTQEEMRQKEQEAQKRRKEREDFIRGCQSPANNPYEGVNLDGLKGLKIEVKSSEERRQETFKRHLEFLKQQKEENERKLKAREEAIRDQKNRETIEEEELCLPFGEEEEW